MKKKVIRIIGILFITAMLVLTFFSNTIMNRSLTVISTERVKRGTVTNKVRVSGVAEKEESMEVKISGARVVDRVLVKTSDRVTKGQVLMTFLEEENSELSAARETLRSLEESYEKSQLTLAPDYTDDRVAIENAREAVREAEASLEAAREYEASSALAGVEATATDAASEAPAGTFAGVSEAEKNLKLKKQQLDSLERALERRIEQDGLSEKIAEIDRANMSNEIDKTRKALSELEQAPDLRQLVSPVDGTVSLITAQSGDELQKGAVCVYISDDEGALVLRTVVSTEEARKLRVGMSAELDNVWGVEAQVIVGGIKPVPESEGSYEVTFDIKGNILEGETLYLSAGEAKKSYETIVPNEAVRGETGSYYVFVTDIKSTPLGNRYYIRKVPVTLLARDSSVSAVSGAVSEGDLCVTTDEEDLKDGQQVRMR